MPFATEEVVIAQPYLAERGTINSNKGIFWINLLEKLNKIDPEVTFKPYELSMSHDYTTNLRIL